MDTYIIVRTEHLNHHGFLFGGQMLKWVDEFAWLTAARDFPGHRLVTRAMDESIFSKGVPNGSILRFRILPCCLGKTSVQYCVEVFADKPGATDEEEVFTTNVTFVSVNDNGTKRQLPENPHYRSEEICG